MMIELIVTLLIFGSGAAANQASLNPGSFSIERADCENLESRGDQRICDLTRMPDRGN